jgi:hypothetical protein
MFVKPKAIPRLFDKDRWETGSPASMADRSLCVWWSWDGKRGKRHFVPLGYRELAGGVVLRGSTFTT